MVFATIGVILAAVYMLWMFQRVMFGKLDSTNESLPDLNQREIVLLIPILILIVWIGVYPNSFLKPMKMSVDEVVRKVDTTNTTPPIGQLEIYENSIESNKMNNTENLILVDEEAQIK